MIRSTSALISLDCPQTLAASMTDDSRPISLEVQADDGTVSSAEALSVGLIVAELVVNAFTRWRKSANSSR